MEIVIDVKELDNLQQMHEQFRKQLQFPENYGNNLDALYDMLTSRQAPLTIKVKKDSNKSWVRLMRMLRDAAAENPAITLKETEE